MLVTIDRITIEPEKRDGKPCVRGLRITVRDVLSWLGAEVTEKNILDKHPHFEPQSRRGRGLVINVQ